MKSFIVVIIALVLFVLALSYIPGADELTSNFIDRTPPKILLGEIEDDVLSIELSDLGAGLKDVNISAHQGENITKLYDEKFPEQTNSRKVTLPIDLRGLGFKEGEVTLTTTSSDQALFSNKAIEEKVVMLDYMKPQIELLTLQHIVHQGGVELVIYSAKDNNLKESGVSVGNSIYPGFPLSYLDPTKSEGNLFGALFALPFDFESLKTKVTLFAKDTSGNRVSQDIFFRVGQFTQLNVEPKLSLEFLQNKIPPLFKQYLRHAPSEASLMLSSPENLVTAFKKVNEDYRQKLDQELHSLLSQDITPRMGTGTFIKPMKSATSSNLGEKRTYQFDGKAISKSVHNGLDLASVQNDKVHAAQDGKVILAKDFGIYGNAVVLDHGLGITTLYGHLASISVNLGETVKKGDPLGNSGQTGLAGGDHLHFEVRVRSTPVNPIEWWDPNWIKDNIDGKIKGIL